MKPLAIDLFCGLPEPIIGAIIFFTWFGCGFLSILFVFSGSEPSQLRAIPAYIWCFATLVGGVLLVYLGGRGLL